MHVSLQLAQRRTDALLLRKMFLQLTSVLCRHLGHASRKFHLRAVSQELGELSKLAPAKPELCKIHGQIEGASQHVAGVGCQRRPGLTMGQTWGAYIAEQLV